MDGITFHLHDFVLYAADVPKGENAPAKIGQVVDVMFPRLEAKRDITVKVKQVGRISSLRHLRPDIMLDEVCISV